MSELVFLLEEESAKAMLEGLLPRILDTRIAVRAIAFEGKQDLEKQLEKKLKNYVNPNARFIIMRDQDSSPDCSAVKESLVDRCRNAGRATSSFVRIACHELETFYLADLAAVEEALAIPGLNARQDKAKYRFPDPLGNPSQELKKLTHERYQKVSGSRMIGQHLDPDNSRSPSFRNLVAAIRRWEHELLDILSHA
jgi:hypothetical protein